MPNNFRITGTHYISKAGNDLNAGTDPNLPKATFTRYGATTVAGCGVYKGALSLGTAAVDFIADGLVVLDATANIAWTIPSSTTSRLNTSSQNSHSFFVRGNGFNFVVTGDASFECFNTIYENVALMQFAVSAGKFINYRNAIFINSRLNTSNGTALLDYCAVFNCTNFTLSNLTTLRNSYIDAATNVVMTTYFTTPATQFRNCNMRGIFVVGGISYELKKDKDGNAIDPNPSIADIATIDATVYTRGNFSQDMDYLAIDKRGYNAVASTSPALFADTSAVGNIANALFADSVNASDSEFTGGVITNLTLSAGDYIVTAGTSGNIISLARQVAPIAVPVGRTNIRCLLNFNSSQAIGSAENNNVTIVENYPAGHADGGDNPRRLTYQMQWSDADTAPASDSEWTNQGYTAPNTWVTFESFQTPLIDANARGNGEPLFNPTGAVGLKFKWRRFKITVRNGIG